MKQIIYKEDKAVSPIIATILLIAITVVLAATLYTVLGGFTSGLSNSGSAAVSGTFANTSTNVKLGYQYTFSVSSTSSGGISISSLELKFTNGTGTFNTGALSSSITFGTNYTVNATSLSSGKLVAGSTITIFVSTGEGHTLSLIQDAISQISIVDTASNSVIYTS